MKHARIPLALTLLLTAAPALAQDEEPVGEANVRYKAVTEIDIEGVEIAGTIDGPNMKLISEPDRMGFHPMIRLRTNFNEEMKESVELLR